MPENVMGTLSELKQKAEDGYARYQEGFGPRIIMISCLELLPLVHEFERLREASGSTYCAYCGERFPLDAPDAADDVSLHISMCEKHPMRQAEAEILRLDTKVTRLRVALERLESCTRDMGEIGVRELTIPEVREIAFDALHAK